MTDYSGFYYNISGLYEDIVYYVSPMPEQQLYMIKKNTLIVDTKAILKSIETGFNGYNYEVYAVELLSKPFDNSYDEDEVGVYVNFTDFSNGQQFEGIIVVSKEMPTFENFYYYLQSKAVDLPIVVEGKSPKAKVIDPNGIIAPRIEHKKEEVKEPEVESEQPKTFNEQIETPQMKAQVEAKSIAEQIVQSNEQTNNDQ